MLYSCVYGFLPESRSAETSTVDVEDATLDELTRQAALAKENARLLEAERAARHRVERVLDLTRRFEDVTQRMSRAMSFDALADAAIAGARDAFGADVTALYLLDEPARQLVLLKQDGMLPIAQRRYPALPLDMDAPIIDSVREAEPIFLAGKDEYAARYPSSAARLSQIYGPRELSVACVPLVESGRAVGGVIFTFLDHREIDEDERRFMCLLADHSALALARARAFEEIRLGAERLAEANRTLAATAEYLRRLQAVTVAFATAGTVEEVGRVVAREGVAAFGADQGVFARAAGPDEVEIIAFAGVERGQIAATHEPLVISTPLTVPFRTAEPFFAGTVDELRAGVPDFEEIRQAFGTRAVASAPIVERGEPHAVIAFGFTRERTFDTSDRNFLRDLTTVTALALARAEHFERERAARRVAEEALERAREADRRKDEFLAILGHELRNPIAPIRTALQVARLRGADPNSREHGIIERQVKHLERLVDDLLDVSRITRGKVELERERLDVADVVARAIDVASPLLEQKKHRLAVEVPRGLTVIGDQMRLVQVITNLLTNAAKYTYKGGDIRVAAVAQGDRLRLSVHDNGMGIDARLLPHVFDMFTQAPQTIERSQGGLGLGLTIVRQIVEMHGGTVEARSDGPDQGSEFVVWLPIERQPAPGDSPEDPPPRDLSAVRGGRRVLVVDDNEDAATLLAEALTTLGNDVRVAGDGLQALEEAARFQPEVVCLDIGLPVLDGYEVAERLRREYGQTMRIIAITGYGQDQDRARALAAGFDRHLVKPVDLDALIAAFD